MKQTEKPEKKPREEPLSFEERWGLIKQQKLAEMIDVATMELLAIEVKEQLTGKKLIH